MCRNFDRIINEIRTEGHIAGKTEGLLEGKTIGILEGKAEGILEGSELEKVNTIERLYLMNANIDVISCACGLNKEDVLNIIHERHLQRPLIS